MDRNSEPVKFWHVCGPLLLYWVIQFVAQLVAELAVMIPHIGQVMDYDALGKEHYDRRDDRGDYEQCAGNVRDCG